MTSLRAKIVWTLLLALLLASIVTTVATFFTTRQEISTLFDAELRHIALSLVENTPTTVEHVSIIGASDQNQIVVQVYDSSTNRLWRSDANEALPVAEAPGFQNVESPDHQQWREFASTSGSRIIQVAQPISMRNDYALSAAMQIVRPLLVLFPFLAIAIWFVAEHFLSPLSKTARAVSQRSPDSMDPIATDGLPHELVSLIEALNHLFERLQESLDVQRRFASDAAHELRTPLAGIRLQAQLLSRAKTAEDRRKYIERLDHGVSRATRLVEQLLTLARLDPECATQPTTEVDLGRLAQSVVEDYLPLAKEKRLTLKAETHPVTILGMEDALRLLISNLSDNALRYTPEGGTIVISVDEDGQAATLRVSDNGPGIAVQERSRVFERFYRALGTHVEGTGLGLAIVERIVRLHAAQIRIDDGLPQCEGHGVGASFSVRFPRKSA